MFIVYTYIYICTIYIHYYICDKNCFLDLRPTVQRTNITPKNVGPKAMSFFSILNTFKAFLSFTITLSLDLCFSTP